MDYPSDISLALKFWAFVVSVICLGIVIARIIDESLVEGQVFAISIFVGIGCIGSFVAMIIYENKESKKEQK